MPTPDELREWRALRGRFLNALWDAEHAGTDWPNVSDLLRAARSPDLSPHHVDRLVETLGEDGLIEGITMAEGSAQQVHLTSYGREEVERWLAEPQRPTEHLPVPASQVFNIGSMNVTGPILQGSTATNVTTTYGVPGDALAKVVTELRRLIEAANPSPEDREDIEADLEIVEEEGSSPQPRMLRVRAVLRRLRLAVTVGALAGAETGAREGVIQTLDAAQRAITGG